MDSVIVACPWCNRFNNLSPESRGQTVSCTRCTKRFMVPAQGGKGLKPEEPKTLGRSITPLPEPGSEKEETMPVRCPHCNALYQMPVRLVGKDVACAKCTKSFQVPRMGTVRISKEAVNTLQPKKESGA